MPAEPHIALVILFVGALVGAIYLVAWHAGHDAGRRGEAPPQDRRP